MKTTVQTIYTGSPQAPRQWSTTNYEIAVDLAAKDARQMSRLFSEVYDKNTNMVVGYVSSDGKEM